MKKIFIAFVIILSGCTDDGNADSKQINLYFKNTSNGPVQIELYAEGDLRTSEIIPSDQSGNAHTFYTRNSFNNFGFITDSLVINFLTEAVISVPLQLTYESLQSQVLSIRLRQIL